jgi:hypothetical protein
MNKSGGVAIEWMRVQLLMIKVVVFYLTLLIVLTILPSILRGQPPVIQTPVASSKGEAAGIIGLLLTMIGLLLTAIIVLWRKAERLEAQKQLMYEELVESTKAMKGIEAELTRAKWLRS